MYAQNFYVARTLDSGLRWKPTFAPGRYFWLIEQLIYLLKWMPFRRAMGTPAWLADGSVCMYCHPHSYLYSNVCCRAIMARIISRADSGISVPNHARQRGARFLKDEDRSGRLRKRIEDCSILVKSLLVCLHRGQETTSRRFLWPDLFSPCLLQLLYSPRDTVSNRYSSSKIWAFETLME